jgi:hypothetical protein
MRRTATLAVLALVLAVPASAAATAPPVGPLPAGPMTTIAAPIS